MIKIIDKPPQRRKVTTYDLEWYPESYILRLVGVYDEIWGYRKYLTIKDFIENELVQETNNRLYYAHAGGLADINFVLEYLKDCLEYHIEALFSGSSAFIVTVTKGKYKWTFVDSYWLLRSPLKKIGKTLGFHKLDCAFDAPLEELILYNERDCVLLHKAIKSFEQELLDLGGELQLTIASCALNLFRRKFLKQNITTSVAINEIAYKCYYASRVEDSIRNGTFLLYNDINSSFPHSMTKPLPGEYIKHSHNLDLTKLCITNVIVDVPDMDFPPLPIRLEGRIFFPTGTWNGWYTGEDLKLLIKCGGTIRKVFDVYYFKPFFDMSDYAKEIFKLKEAANDDPFRRKVYKELLVSLYGKLAERGDRKQIYFNMSKKIWDFMEKEMKEWGNGEFEDKPWDRMGPGIWARNIETLVAHAHVPIPAYVTSYSRRLLYEYMSKVEVHYYCDTDGFACDPCNDESKKLAIKARIIIEQLEKEEKKNPDSKKCILLEKKKKQIILELEHLEEIYTGLNFGTKLGQLKMEKVIGKGMFLSPKFYRMDSYIKTKGFPKLSDIEFEMLIAGDRIHFHRMKRVKESIRKGDMRPHDILVLKGLNNVVKKRKFKRDGTSRPWHISEIRNQLKNI